MIARKAFLVVAFALTAGLATAPGSLTTTAGAQEVEGPPNVLIVVTDDQREDTMQVMPDTRAFFGAGGVRFNNAYATTPLCCPSRASIFTGRFVHNHRVINTQTAERLNHDTTLESYLKEAGYNTAISGKYLNLWNIRSDPPHFDRWAIFNDDYGVDGYRNEQWNVNGSVRKISGYTTTVVGDRAIDFMDGFETDDARPWLLYVFPFAPHSPYTPQGKYAEAVPPKWNKDPSVRERDLSDKPSWVRKQKVSMRDARRARTGQFRTLMSVDDLMTRLVDRLDALQETGDTLVIFTSDNGYMWHDHGLLAKRYAYGPSARVPFFLRYDGGNLSSIDPDAPIANLDIAPTALDAIGISPDSPPMDGRSLLSGPDRSRMLLEYFVEMGVPTWASTVTHETQYIEYYAKNGTRVRFKEYYRLDSDPYQLRNVLKDGKRSNNPSGGEMSSLHQQLAEDRDCRGTNCP